MTEPKERGPKRPFPLHSLQDALKVAQKIRDERAGKPMNRLLLADSLGYKPSSSSFRDLLSSSLKYGLTEGSHNVPTISLTSIGEQATGLDSTKRASALRAAALTPTGVQRVLHCLCREQAAVPRHVREGACLRLQCA